MPQHTTVLLTGATGFLGSHLLRALLEMGYTVVASKRQQSSFHRIEGIKDHPHLFFYDSQTIGQALTDHQVKVIMHTATCYGRDGEAFSDVMESNIMFPLRILEQGILSGVKGFINTDTFFHKQMGLKPGERCYVLSKKTFAEAAKIFIENTAMKFVNLRAEQIYGPHDSMKKFVPVMIDRLKKHEHIALTPGEQRRDFVYVDDVVRAFIKSLEHLDALEKVEEFGIGSGHSTSIKESVEMMKSITRSRSSLGWGELPYRDQEIKESIADLSHNYKIHWQAKTTLQDGLTKTIASA